MKLKLNFKIKKIRFEKYILGIGSILLTTLLISLFIYYFIASSESEIEVSNRRLSTLKRKLKSINNYRPSPNSSNIDKIIKDTEYVKTQLLLLKSAFGNPYIKPLLSFYSGLKKDAKKTATTTTSEENMNELFSFLNSWKSYYNKNKPKLENSESAKTSFLNYLEKSNYTPKVFYRALEDFRNSLQNHMIEKPDSIITEDYFFNSIGFPLRISRIQCKELIREIENKINIKLHENKILSKSQNIKLFDEFTTMPNDDQIPHIINYLWFYQDLISKIVDSGIESMPTHKKLNGLRGTTKGEFTILKYEVEIIGSMTAIRKFVDELQTANKNNSIYELDYISIVSAVDSAAKLQLPTQRKRTLNINIEIGSAELLKANMKLSYYIYNKPIINL